MDVFNKAIEIFRGISAQRDEASATLLAKVQARVSPILDRAHNALGVFSDLEQTQRARLAEVRRALPDETLLDSPATQRTITELRTHLAYVLDALAKRPQQIRTALAVLESLTGKEVDLEGRLLNAQHDIESAGAGEGIRKHIAEIESLCERLEKLPLSPAPAVTFINPPPAPREPSIVLARTE